MVSLGDQCENKHRMQSQDQETSTHRDQFRVKEELEQEQSEWVQGNYHEKGHESWHLALLAAS